MVSKRQSKFIKSLKIKKYRAQEKCFIIEGKKNVLEVINSGYTIRLLLATSEFINENVLPESINKETLFEVNSVQLQDLGTFTTNNDCLAVAEMKEFSISDLDPGQIFIALDGVKDPGNLGTIIRTMDWFGLNQLICSPNTAEWYNPKVINATMGSFTRVRCVYTDLKQFIETSSLPAFGADLSGIPLDEWHATKPYIVVMGSESHGISENVASVLRARISIPRKGEAESLNVAIATGIICHHLTL